MDNKDKKILGILEENGRESYTEISDRVGVSEGTVRNRIDKMREQDIIEKFTVKTTSKGSKALVMANVDTNANLTNVVDQFPNDIHVMEITGKYDLILEIESTSNQKINSIIDKVRAIEGISYTETYMVLKEKF